MAGKVIGANGRRLAAENHAEAISRAGELFPIVVEFRGSGLSYRQMVARLNERREQTPGGAGRWHVRTLQRLVQRAPEVEAHLAHAIIARSDATERAVDAERIDGGVDRMDAVLAASRRLREAQQGLRARTAALLRFNRTLRTEMVALRTSTKVQLETSGSFTTLQVADLFALPPAARGRANRA